MSNKTELCYPNKLTRPVMSDSVPHKCKFFLQMKILNKIYLPPWSHTEIKVPKYRRYQSSIPFFDASVLVRTASFISSAEVWSLPSFFSNCHVQSFSRTNAPLSAPLTVGELESHVSHTDPKFQTAIGSKKEEQSTSKFRSNNQSPGTDVIAATVYNLS